MDKLRQKTVKQELLYSNYTLQKLTQQQQQETHSVHSFLILAEALLEKAKWGAGTFITVEW